MKKAKRAAAAAILFCICFSFVLSLYTAATEKTGKKSRTGDFSASHSAVLYDNRNGLPTSEANAIVQSDDGFIWIGGYSGLIRYDGNEFYRYESSGGLASVVALFIDSKDRLWIGTNDSGAAVYKNDELTFFGLAEGLRSSSVRSMIEDNDGNIMIATTTGLAYVDGNDTLHVIDDRLVNNEYVCELVKDSSGTIYGVTLTGGIFTVDDRKISGYYSSADMNLEIINTVYPDPEKPGYVYLGAQESPVIYHGKLDGDKFDTLRAEPFETINAIRLYGDELWVCTDVGIGVFRNGVFEPLTDLPMTNSIDHVMMDYEGNLWFTSSRQGVMKIVDNRFMDLSNLSGLPLLIVNSTCLCGDDMYIGTDTGLYILDGDMNITENEITALLKDVRIRCIKQTDDGYIWMCTYSNDGLVRYDPKTGEAVFYDENAGMASNRVRTLIQLSDGTIAAATNAGLNIIKDGVVTETFGKSAGIGNLEILCVEEGENGKLYLGSDGGGIYIIDGAKVSRLGIESGLRSEVILRIKRDPVDKSTFWIITSNSLSYMKDGKITTLSSFPYANNFDIFFDKYDRAWITASNGIYVVKRDDLLSDSVAEYTLFDRDYGLPGIATANSYNHITSDGTLYVSATTCVYSVNINEETGGGNEIKLSVPFIEYDDNTVWTNGSDTVHIPANCKRLNIYANAFTYSLNDPHMCYMLEGFDDAPTYITKQEMTYASYTNLEGGTYKFILSIINDVTGETEKTVELTIIKTRALYEQIWFMVLVALAILGLILLAVMLIFRKKTKALLRKQEETKKLIDEMTKVFSGCIDMKDAYTNGHSARVAKYTAMMAEKMGKSKDEVAEIYNIALLHDIGKIGIPDSILNKPGKLDNDEYSVMKSHAQRGYDILKEVNIDPDLALGAGYHHEKYDGSGYPSGLRGDQIPEIARIIAVADAFDAMYSTRPYRKKMPIETVAAEIKRCSGTQFAPEVVDVFLKLVEEGKLTDDSVN